MSEENILDIESLMAKARCPETGDALEAFDEGLYSAGECIYPVLCGTPILAPRIDRFLGNEVWSISRAIAEFGEDEELKSWFFSRYSTLDSDYISPVDTEVPGEGYPGFWDCPALPTFVSELVRRTPEDVIEERVQGTRYPMGLDVGCGQGGMVQRMADHCTVALGVEVNPYLAMLANRHLIASEILVRYFVPEDGPAREVLPKPPAPNARVVCADVNLLPFEAETFDWINCGHLLDLSDDPASLLSDIIGLLKPGGLLTISSPLDFRHQGHFVGMFGLLARDFEETYQEDGIPWLRFNHKRRFVLHEDWIWMGIKNPGPDVEE